MKTYKKIIILVNLLLLLLFINWSIFSKENTLRNGKLVLLELAPVDPRSLMQGDYMELSYAITRTGFDGSKPRYSRTGYCVIRLNEHNVAEKVRIQQNPEPLSNGEYLLKYKSITPWQVQIGAESYFFEEGKSKQFEKAKYGGLRIEENGTCVLVGLYDTTFHYIKP